MSGTVNVARDLWDDPTFKDSEMSQREAWIWMIAEASWKARSRRIGTCEVELRRGQLAASSRFMAAAWLWSEPRVRRYLEMLENRRMITRVTDAGVTVITICKYDDYQNAPRVDDAAATHQPTQERRTTDANENKGVIREYIGGGGSASAREVENPLPPKNPDDHATDRELILEAMGLGPDGIAGPSRFLGGQGDMAEARRWLELPGLTFAAVLAEITRIRATKTDGPPSSFRYFTPAMQRLSAQLSAGPLAPSADAQPRASPGRAPLPPIDLDRLNDDGSFRQ